MARRPPLYFVPDLSPKDRKALAKTEIRFLFVGESPHVSEITPKNEKDRRPLCGAAGKQWWRLLGEILEKNPSTDVSLERLLHFCSRHGIAILNSVQYPLDSKISEKFPKADPFTNIGFSKASGPSFYKKLKSSRDVHLAIRSLRERITHPGLDDLPVHYLGNDEEWFVTRALEMGGIQNRLGEKIPHPSAWWRRGGYYGRVAQEKLQKILTNS